MAAQSYANVAAATAASPSHGSMMNGSNNNNNNNFNNNHSTTTKPLHQLEDLYNPTPTSMPLVGALCLLDSPLVMKTKEEHVFLMTKGYLQNWIVWAYHQHVPQNEIRRLQRALRTAAEMHNLKAPSLDTHDFHNPGPIDNRALSNVTNCFLLREELAVEPVETNGSTGTATCCAVPEPFYEFLRSVHGVLCEDGRSISFQPFENFDHILYHFGPPRNPNEPARPVEFRRRVELVPEVIHTNYDNEMNGGKADSPTSKLMKQGREAKAPRFIPEVEVYPIKVIYSVAVKDHGSLDSEVMLPSETTGFVLVSRASKVVDVMPILTRACAPKQPSSCVRLWSKRQTLRQDKKTDATRTGDGYDLIELGRLDGKLVRKDEPAEPSEMDMREWVYRQNGPNRRREVEILVETRVNASMTWARLSMEFANRIEVGDFVDAQDSTGKWYEAVVREVTEDTVTVHYIGWASKWDGKLRRFPGSEEVAGVSKIVNAPAPLYAHSPRWRESLRTGDCVDIRESSSQVNNPKWYRGIVQQLAGEDDPQRKISGGAKLEKYAISGESENGKGPKRQSLLLLMRKRQVLIEVPQERQQRNFAAAATVYDSDALERSSLRWVHLFSEEICEAGTHLKSEEVNRPTTLRYVYDTRRPPVEVLKTFNNIHGSGFIRESLRGQPPAPGSVGLQNLGNSCFMNSIIQCVNHVDPLTQYLLKGDYLKDLNRKNPLGSGGMVSTAYSQLLRDMWGGEYSVLAPRILKQAVASFAPQFNNVFQHDSHEFCSVLMDAIHEDCNRVLTKPYVEETEGLGMPDDKVAIESWRKHLLRHDSVIVDHCQGLHRSHLTCPVCGHESIKFDVFSSISLPLAASKGGSAIPLDDCLEKFTEGEQLDENNAWYCVNCKKHVCALKMLALWSVPDILILHLKRFTYENKGGGVVRSKMEDKVIFPIDSLDLRPYILGPIDEDAPPVYNLFGVSEHTGSTANSGHYTATVRNSRDSNWYKYNDSHVGSSSGEASVTGGAYLLFYKRAKGTSRWAGLEKAMQMRGVDPRGALEKDQDGFTKVKTKKNRKKA